MSSENDKFLPEAILKKRIHKGKEAYYIKWVGYPMEDCTWEPASNFQFSDSIRQFVRDQLKELDDAKEKEDNVKKCVSKLSGRCLKFDAGCRPESCAGIGMIAGVHHVWVKFKDHDDVELVPLNRFKTNWPELLIQFLGKVLQNDGDALVPKSPDN